MQPAKTETPSDRPPAFHWTPNLDGTVSLHYGGKHIKIYSPGGNLWYAMVNGKHLRTAQTRLWRKNWLLGAQAAIEEWLLAGGEGCPK